MQRDLELPLVLRDAPLRGAPQHEGEDCAPSPDRREECSDEAIQESQRPLWIASLRSN